jgi:hypothetical protein
MCIRDRRGLADRSVLTSYLNQPFGRFRRAGVGAIVADA